jgi:hypothetical protein
LQMSVDEGTFFQRPRHLFSTDLFGCAPAQTRLLFGRRGLRECDTLAPSPFAPGFGAGAPSLDLPSCGSHACEARGSYLPHSCQLCFPRGRRLTI